VVPFRLYSCAKPVNGSAIGQPNPSLSPLQSLKAGFFVYTKHNRVLGRIQIEPDHIGSFAAKFRVGADTLTLPAIQMQMVLSHHPPDLRGEIASHPHFSD
jgi:hypothetical protein